MSNLPAYRKTLAALVGAVLTWGVTAQDGGIQSQEWWALAVAAATTLGVFGVSNEPTGEDAEGGQSVIHVLGVIFLVLIVFWLLNGRR